MAQMTSNLEQNKPGNREFLGSLPVELDRVFRAPIELVWQAWTSAEMVKKWWGPQGYSAPETRMDFREGGTYNFAMKGPDGKVNWSGGEIEEIVPMKKLVYTDRFTDESGKAIDPKEIGMPGNWPESCYVTITFEKLGDHETRMHLLHQGIPKSMHDDCVQGWDSSLDKMQKLVEGGSRSIMDQ